MPFNEKFTPRVMAPKPKLSLSDNLRFAKTILSIPTCVPVTAVRHSVFPPPNSQGVHKAIVRRLLRTILSTPIPQQIAYFAAFEVPTGKTVARFCSKHKPRLDLTIVPLAHSSALHIISSWAGDPSTRLSSSPGSHQPKIILFLHGGGYVHMPGPSHIPFAYDCTRAHSTLSSPATLAVLEYTLSTVEPFPRQLQQSIAALNHILTMTIPENIIILGDSAGAHLAIGLLAHIMYPIATGPPEVRAGAKQWGVPELGTVNLPQGAQLGGLCLVSPMLSEDLTKPSYDTNSHYDFLNRKCVQEMINQFLPPTQPPRDSPVSVFLKSQLSPANAPEGFWTGMPVNRTLITVGGYEVFHDSAVEFTAQLKRDVGGARAESVELVVGKEEWHDAPTVDRLFKIKERIGGSADEIIRWMRETGTDRT